MPITFTCPKCQKSYTVKDSLAGEKGSCKGCGESIRIPKQIDSTPPNVAQPLPSLSTGEQTLWKATGSQIENLGTFFVCSLVAVSGLIGCFASAWFLFLVPLAGLAAWWAWFKTRCKSFELTNQRLRLAAGVFSRVVEDVELFRVKDTMATQPFFLRLLGRGNILVVSSDQLERKIEINGVKDPLQLRETMRSHVTEQRKLKGVREVDMR